MKLSTAILTILLTWSCSNNDNSNLTADTNTIPDTTTTPTFVDTLDWTIIDEHFEYAFADNQSALAASLPIQMEGVGILNSEGQFSQGDSFSQYGITEEQLFGVKSVDDVIRKNSGKSIYFKIKTDFIISQRKDLLENIFVSPVDELNQGGFDKLLTDLNDLEYVEQAEITKQENTIKLSANDKDSIVFVQLKDSIVFVQLKVTQENRNPDSLTSKSNQLKIDKRIGSAFYNDLLEQMKRQYLIIKITHHNKG